MISINHEERASILKGISPKNIPPLKKYSIPPPEKPLIAKKEVTKATRPTEMMLITGFILCGTRGSAIIPDNKTNANALKRKPINSLSSYTIIY
jgi:hypothetical protein